ncbi:MAG: helix-turn-helix transcriptional regulator [Geminicoccaceae bacterium]
MTAAFSDEHLYDLAKAFPSEVVNRLIEGESPVRVYREYRGLTQKALAKKVGVDSNYLSRIERGTRTGSVAFLRKVANALEVKLDDLVPAD